MRVVYIHPSSRDFDTLFSKKGGSLSDINIFHNRGGSLLSFVGRFARYALPFIKSIILPEVGNFANNVANDVSQGRSVKRVFKERGLESAVNIGKRVAKKARGGAKKKKITANKNLKKNIKRKKCVTKKDIFNTNKFRL